MSPLLLRRAAAAAGLTVAALALAATPALATPQLVLSLSPVDTSSDGRYVLFYDGSVLDRAIGVTVILPTDGEPLDLSSDGKSALQRGGDGRLRVRTTTSPAGTLVDTDQLGNTVPVGTAVLVDGGKRVLFSTLEPQPRIFEHVLGGASTLRLSGATLLGASEDGRVVTWKKPLLSVSAPPGADDNTPGPREFDGRISGTAVGYQFRGGSSRVLSVSSLRQNRYDDQTTGCPTYVSTTKTDPFKLEVSQDGATERYRLMLGTQTSTSSYPSTASTYTQFGEQRSEVVATSDGQRGSVLVRTDPVSGAYAIESYQRANSIWNSATVIGDDGTPLSLSVEVPGSTDTAAYMYRVVPVQRGAAAVYYAKPRAASPPAPGIPTFEGTWAINAGAPLGESTMPWLSAPRSADPVDGPATKIDASWLDCGDGPAPAGAPADYAPITVKTTGNSAGSVTAQLTPAGKLAATSVSVTVSWYGIPLWSKTTTRSGVINLPGLVPGLPGFAVAVKVKLTGGATISHGAALRRTR